jgi:hypothetical protein
MGSNEQSLERVGVHATGDQSGRRHTLSDERVPSRQGAGNGLGSGRDSANDKNGDYMYNEKAAAPSGLTPRTDGFEAHGASKRGDQENTATSQIERQNIKIQEGALGSANAGAGGRTDEHWSVGGDHNQHGLHSSLSPQKNEKTTLGGESPDKDRSHSKSPRKTTSRIVAAVQPSNVQI